MAAMGPGGPQAPQGPGGPEGGPEEFRSEKIINFAIAGGLVVVATGADVYLYSEGDITGMMAVLAFAIPCFIIVVTTWSSYDTKHAVDRAMRSARGIHHRRNPMAGAAFGILLDIPMKLIDMMMSDEAVERTLLTFIVPFAVVIGIFLMVPDPESYPGFLRWLLFEFSPVVTTSTRRGLGTY